MLSIIVLVLIVGTILAIESRGTTMTALATPDAHATPGRGARVFVSRLYFYGVALISLIAGIIAVDNLLYVLDRVWLDRGGLGAVDVFSRDAVASNGGLLLVATPIYVLHWGFVQRRVDAAEVASALRKLFLYIASGVAAGYSLYNAYLLLDEATRLALGSPLIDSAIWPAGWLHRVLMVAVGLALLRYFQAVAYADGDRGAEIGWAGTWRRLYQTLLGVAGLALVILGIGGAIELLVGEWLIAPSEFLRSGWTRDALADAVAKALVGLVLLRVNWQRWRNLSAAFPGEAQAALRRLYLYVAVVGGALTVLLPLGGLLNDVLRVLFGVLGWSDYDLRETLTRAIAYAPVGLVIWLWHWRFLQREALAHGESEAGATIRRLYYYVVAATGLVLLWLGLVETVQVLLDLGLRSARAVDDRFWANPLATGLSLLAVGAPIWAYHWQRMQRVARRDDAAGQAERSSGPRRVFLYGVALVSALVVLFFLGQVVYRILLIALGDPTATMSELTTVADLARSVIAAAIWVFHVLAIRGDGRLGIEAPAPAAPALDERRAALAARIADLEQELAAAKAELAALPAPDQPDGAP
jgi:hypothetical protein